MSVQDDDGFEPQGFDLAEILRRLWDGRVIILLSTIVCVIFAAFYLRGATYVYTATVTVFPTQGQGPTVTGRLTDLASLAGVDLSKGGTTPPFMLFSNVLGSRTVADALARDPRILHTVFKNQWDNESAQWLPPGGMRKDVTDAVKSFIGIPVYPWHPPGGGELQDYVSQNVKASDNARVSTLTVSYLDPDPAFAAYFLQALVKAADDQLRAVTVDRAKKYAQYLDRQLDGTQTAAMRQILTQAMSDQTTTIMMGSSDTWFAAQPLGSVVASTKPSQPKPSLVLVMSVFLGGGIGAALAFFGVRLPTGRTRMRLWPRKLPEQVS